MARSNGNKSRSAGPGNAASGDTTGSAASGGSGSTNGDTGSANGIGGDGGLFSNEGGADGNDTERGEVHGGGRVGDSESSSEPTGGSTGSDRGNRAARRGRGRPSNAEREASLASGNVPVTEIPAPADLSHTRLGRKRKKGNNASSVAAVGLALGLAFDARRYMLGPGFEFWELSDAEKNDLAAKAVACLDALPAGKSNKVIQWILQQVETVTPFVALAGAGYSTLAWRMTMTKQLKAAQRGGPRATGNNGANVEPSSNGVSGDANAGGNAVQTGVNSGDPTGGNGSAAPGRPNGDVAQLFAPPPHITA